MQKKLTITVDESVYDGLHRVAGPRRISPFIGKSYTVAPPNHRSRG